MCTELPRVTRCCFCFSLRTGSLIIGYFSMLSAVLAMSVAGTFIWLVAVYESKYEDNPPPGHSADEIRRNALRIYIVHSLQILVYVFYFAISLLLVVGAHKNIPRYMRHYFFAGMMNIVFNLMITVATFIITGFTTTVSQLVSCAIMFYFVVVIRSSYLEMEERSKPPAYQMNLYYPTTQAPLVA